VFACVCLWAVAVSMSIEELEDILTVDDDVKDGCVAQVPTVNQLVSCLQLFPLEDPFSNSISASW